MKTDRAHQGNAMRILASLNDNSRLSVVNSTAACALVYAVLDLAQAVRELKSEVPGND